MKIVRVLTFLLVLLVIVPAALAQTTSGQETTRVQSIQLDMPASVSVSTTTPVTLTYKGGENETITVTARSLESGNPVDPILTITDNGGTELATNDDHRTSRTDLAPRDSLIADLVLPSTQRYSIIVSSYEGAGDVEVLLTHESGSVAVAQPTGEDETIEASVPDDGAFTYDFVASAGEVVTITVRGTDNIIDPKFALLDSSGAVLADNDDHDSVDPSLAPYDAQLEDFVIPADDTYTVRITGFSNVGGTIELTISRSADGQQNPPDPATPPPSNGTTQVFEGEINPNDLETYTFDANAGDLYTITVVATTNGFDPRLSVYFNAVYVNDNDDYGSTDPDMQPTDARLYNLLITESGEYEVDVQGYRDSSGNYTLTIERTATNVSTGAPDEQFETGSIEAGQTYSFNFDAQAGDYVTITARGLSFEFNPYVALLNDAGTVLIDNDDHGMGYLAFRDSQIPNYIIDETGTYTVEVTNVTGDAGTFALTLSTRR
ncbi:MAG: hypothetical protein ABI835_17915 [Chloroflexota bacterium]